MAPAILSNKPSVKKINSKQNMKKMELDEPVAETKHKEDDFLSLKAKLSLENCFISNLLNNVPRVNEESDSDEGDVNSGSSNKFNVHGHSNGAEKLDREELKKKLAAKLSEFQGKNSAHN